MAVRGRRRRWQPGWRRGELQRLRDLAGRTRGCRQGRRRRPQIEQLAVKAGGAEEEQVGAVGVRIG
jgi:hypothetical protein